ncbi:MAG: rubrerythrin family protein [Christensenellaceae bacterium]|jgi:rubrerythrin|nr:rubrerythrin family protein [Christensenellaceae bacterium]
MELKGSKTEQNLKTAFSGESEARNKYTYFASKAKKDGYPVIASVFEETAANEKEHAELWFKKLGGINDTMANLIAAAAGEKYEWSDMYAEFSRVAKEEGFNDLAVQFAHIGSIEREHEARYLRLADELKSGKLFHRDEPVAWICTNCGKHVISKDAPDLCPACQHPQGYFTVDTTVDGQKLAK